LGRGFLGQSRGVKWATGRGPFRDCVRERKRNSGKMEEKGLCDGSTIDATGSIAFKKPEGHLNKKKSGEKFEREFSKGKTRIGTVLRGYFFMGKKEIKK